MLARTVESGVQLFSRTRQKVGNISGINPTLFSDGGPLGGQIIEINVTPGVDYTDIIIDFIVKAILPTKVCNEFKEVDIILFNTDFQISLLKIIKVIEKKLESYDLGSETKVVIEESLKRLIILNCFSFEQFEITVYNLENILTKYENAGLLIIDNILSQFWVAKYDSTMLSFEEHASKILSLIHNRIKEWSIVLMYTKLITSEMRRSEKIHQAISYTIDVFKNNEEYWTKVRNNENNTCVTVPFKMF